MNGIKKEKKMGSRETILARAKANKPDLLELPIVNPDVFADGRTVFEEFTKKVEIAGGNVFEATSNEHIMVQVKAIFPDAKVNFSTLTGVKDFNSIPLEFLKNPHKLEDLDILILESTLGVAENGALWLADKQLPSRVLPFITKHLVLVLNKENIVPFLHQAYSKLATQQADFGVFISGPSKTADIEQSLVIGAHGALSMSVFLV